jgi:hypothetical protein
MCRNSGVSVAVQSAHAGSEDSSVVELYMRLERVMLKFEGLHEVVSGVKVRQYVALDK